MNKNLLHERIFHDINYDNYLVQYQGDIEAEMSIRPNFYVSILDDTYAIVSVNKNLEINMSSETYFKTIKYVVPGEFFTLQQISPEEASQASYIQIGSPLNLTGKGVDVALIDSGIDYLSEEFMDSNGETRIESIWDQTIITTDFNNTDPVPSGVIYDKKRINEAIKAKREGNSPYDIVPSKDDIGHGTNMAGIIGANDKIQGLKGVSFECDFVVVKLLRDFSYETQFPETTVPVYNLTMIFAAIQYLYEYTFISKRPMVIYLPVGSTSGNHKGGGVLEQLIDRISTSNGLVVVSGTGNQRNTGGHASGTATEVVGVQQQEASIIEFSASPEQRNLWGLEIWSDVPNSYSIEVVSPSGESTGIMTIIINYTINHVFIFEKTSLKVNYYFPEETTGDELIRLRFYNLQPGIWRIRLYANYITTGRYNAWLPQSGLTVGDTKFSFSDPFGTITNPSNSLHIVTIAAYNQNNNNLVDYSGMAFLESYINRIDLAAGGVNALTVAPGNKTAVANGTSVAAAVAAGVCAMLFQWGIVNGNNPYMYAETLKAYLAKGGIARSGDLIPNPYWGYGILSVTKIFENMT